MSSSAPGRGACGRAAWPECLRAGPGRASPRLMDGAEGDSVMRRVRDQDARSSERERPELVERGRGLVRRHRVGPGVEKRRPEIAPPAVREPGKSDHLGRALQPAPRGDPSPDECARPSERPDLPDRAVPLLRLRKQRDADIDRMHRHGRPSISDIERVGGSDAIPTLRRANAAVDTQSRRRATASGRRTWSVCASESDAQTLHVAAADAETLRRKQTRTRASRWS